jgi:hypothetical protein
MHHILDPRVGRPADSIWRTVSVAAALSLAANIASTAAVANGFCLRRGRGGGCTQSCGRHDGGQGGALSLV